MCWRCHIDNERDLAYSAGYDEGLHRGRAEGELRTVERIARDRRTGALPTGAVWLDLQTWRRIQQACHPDRNPSAAAAAVATWLNRVRDRVTA